MYHNQNVITEVMIRLAVKDPGATDTELRLKAEYAIRVERALQSVMVQEDSDYAESAAIYERFIQDARDDDRNQGSETFGFAQAEAGIGAQDLYQSSGAEESVGVGDEEARHGGRGYFGGLWGNVSGSGRS